MLIILHLKTIKFSQVGGGTCPLELEADTDEDVMFQFSTQAKGAHTELMAAATPESMTKWEEDFAKT